MDGQDLEPRLPEGGAEADTVSLLDLLGVVVRHRRLIVIFTAVVAAVALAFLVVTKVLPVDSPYNRYPDFFRPSAKLVLQESSGGSSMLSDSGSGGLGALASLMNLSTAKSSSAQLALALLESNTVRDQIAAEFDFAGRYHITKNPKTGSRSLIAKALTAKYNEESGILEISYQDTDRQFATDVTNRAVDLLQEMFSRLTLERVRDKQKLLAASIEAQQKEKDDATGKLIAFQKRYGVVDLSTQAPANAQSVANAYAAKIARQVDLNIRMQYYPESDPGVQRLKDEIAQYDKLIAELKSGSGSFDIGTLPQKLIPEVSAQYAALKSEAELQQAIFITLRQQYEAARIEELNTARTLQVVEPAEVPEVKSGPSRAKVGIIAAVSGLLVGVLLAFLREYFVRAQHDPLERRKLSLIRESMGRGRRR